MPPLSTSSNLKESGLGLRTLNSLAKAARALMGAGSPEALQTGLSLSLRPVHVHDRVQEAVVVGGCEPFLRRLTFREHQMCHPACHVRRFFLGGRTRLLSYWCVSNNARKHLANVSHHTSFPQQACLESLWQSRYPPASAALNSPRCDASPCLPHIEVVPGVLERFMQLLRNLDNGQAFTRDQGHRYQVRRYTGPDPIQHHQYLPAPVILKQGRAS